MLQPSHARGILFLPDAMFDALRRWFQPLRIDDPLFGPLRYQRRAEFWEGWTRFGPVDRLVEVVIESGEDGPTEVHRQFWRQLETDYTSLLPLLAAVLHEALGEWGETIELEEVWNIFTLTGITIPNPAKQPMHWELSFDCAADANHSFDVQMDHWTPHGVAING